MATKKAASGSEGGSFTMQEVKALVQAIEGTDVTSLVWARGDQKVVIRRGQQVLPVTPFVAHAAPVTAPIPAPAAAHAPPAAPASPKAEKPAEKPGALVTSPFVGTFYRAPSPDSQPYVDVGSKVKKGQVLCIVEAMKLMNEIEAEVEGKVAEILVQNATPVEFGQPLFRIEPA
ncbi:MAG: acetyl-CoA carboxylase biotin carboxyl carrier protein [Deltaproteobacteria bacterium]|nr:acetyl-CoA carboxylase biotin carboxyl carrier protein [Deltaproteobacteria bacterium]